jgi:hypothetical protein
LDSRRHVVAVPADAEAVTVGREAREPGVQALVDDRVDRSNSSSAARTGSPE